jgi:hypothetical protein
MFLQMIKDNPPHLPIAHNATGDCTTLYYGASWELGAMNWVPLQRTTVASTGRKHKHTPIKGFLM